MKEYTITIALSDETAARLQRLTELRNRTFFETEEHSDRDMLETLCRTGIESAVVDKLDFWERALGAALKAMPESENAKGVGK